MAGYRLVTQETARGPRAGVLVEGRVHDIADATGNPADATMLSLLADWDAARARLARLCDAPPSNGADAASARLLAPLPLPGTVFCAGANYGDHVREMARMRGKEPDPDPRSLGLTAWHFIKSSRAVVGPGAEIPLPRNSQKVDWEVELAVVIGRKGKSVPVAEALGLVAGYAVANDLSARDLGPRAGVPDASPFKYDWLAHKSFDGSCPLGPWIVPAEDIRDPQALRISLSVNGVMKQDSNTREMIFGIAEQIAHLSDRLTLWPGDVILTGTPAGVGSARGEFLRPGDLVTVAVEGIGEFSNRMA
ncbi:fumarylacetoacetate hydrolase family protein [Muricoccus aerilatus]|uniref:fumarylacetoacetate hydrolase family protein n=1 Tax=Muricoccus aerilatus TaxID=452982 RepID=UPI0005C1D32E|nr:fumarylacetoacetate hydrolase family protein [Roseomonas aerilata]